MTKLKAASAEKTKLMSERRGWIVFAAFLALMGLALTAHGGRFVTLAYTPLALLVAVYFLYRHERIYLVFVLVVLCFTPFVRRVADFGGPITLASPILGAPTLVTFISLLRVRTMRVFDPKNMVFILPMVAILYGTVIGVLHAGLRSVAIPLLAWTGPLAVGVFCYLHEDENHTLAKTFNKSIVLIGTIVALYGIIQYFSPFAWDTDWLAQMQANGQATSMGTPEPYGIRVFATTSNAQGAGSLYGFAVLIASLYRSRWKLISIVAIIFALALTSVRSAWVACALAGVVLLLRVSAKAKVKAVAFLVVLIVLGSIMAATPLGDRLTERVATLGSVKTDGSYRDRQLGRLEAEKIIQQEPFGLGLGYETSDSKRVHFAGTDLGITTMLIELGYLGSMLYGIALVMLLLGPLWKGLKLHGEGLSLAAGMLFMTLLFANTDPLSNALGILFWIPVALLVKYLGTDAEMVRTRRSRVVGRVSLSHGSEAVLQRLGGDGAVEVR